MLLFFLHLNSTIAKPFSSFFEGIAHVTLHLPNSPIKKPPVLEENKTKYKAL